MALQWIDETGIWESDHLCVLFYAMDGDERIEFAIFRKSLGDMNQSAELVDMTRSTDVDERRKGFTEMFEAKREVIRAAAERRYAAGASAGDRVILEREDF